MRGMFGRHIGPVLRVDQPVLRQDPGRGLEAANVAPDGESPAGDAEFIVLGLEPETGVLDETVEALCQRDVSGEG